MHKLTNHLKTHPELLLQLHCAIRLELQNNQQEKKALMKRLLALKSSDEVAYKQLVADEGFNIDDCRDTLRDIAKDIEKCVEKEFGEYDRIACVGDDAIGKIFGGRRLDVLSIVSSVRDPVCAWVVADCKFAMKRPTYGTVCSVNNFAHDVGAKYDAVFEDLALECESVWRKRLILVTTEARPIIFRYIMQRRLGTGHPLMGPGDYELCDVESIGGLIKKARNQFKTAVCGGLCLPAVFG